MHGVPAASQNEYTLVPMRKLGEVDDVVWIEPEWTLSIRNGGAGDDR